MWFTADFILTIYPIIAFWKDFPLSRPPRRADCFMVQRYCCGRMPSTAKANKSPDLTTTFLNFRQAEIGYFFASLNNSSLTPCLFTCLISLVTQSLTHIKHIPVVNSEGFQAKGNKNKLNNKNLRLCRIGAALRMR